MAKTALILGVDTADGAYLARLLGARGYRLWGTGGPGLIEELGIAADVVRHNSIGAAVSDARADEVYDLRPLGRYRAAATVELLRILGRERLFSAGSSAPDAASAAIAAARANGRFAVTGHLFDRESRLGPGTSPVARIVVAARAGAEPSANDLDTVSDCGWTPEYVDAMWRMLQRAKPADFTISTGRALGGHEVARHAFAYFGRDATRFGGDAMATEAFGDPGPARADLGWRAATWGRDLVRTLCEGLAA